MKKFLNVVMSLLLVGLTCILVYAALNLNGIDLHWNTALISSAVPQAPVKADFDYMAVMITRQRSDIHE